MNGSVTYLSPPLSVCVCVLVSTFSWIWKMAGTFRGGGCSFVGVTTCELGSHINPFNY